MDLEELKRLAQDATQGIWYDDSEWSPDDVSIWCGSQEDAEFIGNIGGSRVKEVGVAFDVDVRNGKFISAANPSAILKLIDRCEKAEAKLSEMEKQEPIGHMVRGNFFYSLSAALKSADYITENYENVDVVPVYALPVPQQSVINMPAPDDGWHSYTPEQITKAVEAHGYKVVFATTNN